MNTFKLEYKTHEEYIQEVMKFGYTEQEAINILNGKNPDGTPFVELPF